MKIEDLLRTVAIGLIWPDGSYIPMAPGRWYVLFRGRQRPLLMSARAERFQQEGLRYFVGGGVKALYARSLLKLSSLVPGAGFLPQLQVKPSQPGEDSGPVPVGNARVAAVQIGTPGPYQKASGLLMSEQGEALALAKVAMVASADRMVTLEAGWLRTIAEIGNLDGQVPRLLATGTALSGRRFLVTTLAPTTRFTRSFTTAHLAFLAALGRARLQVERFTASPCYRNLEWSLSQLESSVSRDVLLVMEQALRDCRRSLSDWCGPFVIAQGDFAPWNIRQQHDRIFVFDWEYACTGANPLFDALNYFLMPRAVSGPAPTPRFLARVMRRVQEIACRLHPEWNWRERVVSAFSLVYLLHILVCYARSRMRFDLEHPVMSRYWKLLERRAEWMVTC